MDPEAALCPATVAIAAGRPARVPGAPLNEPVTLTSTYVANGERTYGRIANPTWAAFEETVGALEHGEAISFASGMAATHAVLATLPLGATVLVPRHSYAGTLDLLDAEAARGALRVERFDATDPATLEPLLPGAAAVWIESPTNPMLEVIGIAALAQTAHASGVLVVVDNTFATPIVQRPLNLGADVVVHSASKFLAGHSDVILGVVVTRDTALLGALHEHRDRTGAVPGPLEAFLALRGVRTLPVRMKQAQENALVLATWLEASDRAVTRVRYPGLESDPGHEIAQRQMDGFGAMIAVELSGPAESIEEACNRTTLWTHATSLGGVESTLERRRRWEFEPATVPETLVRLSVGCEDVRDLWDDLDQAFLAGTEVAYRRAKRAELLKRQP